MSLLGREVEKVFIDGLIAQFSRSHPDAGNLPDRIPATVARARAYGFSSDDDLEWFVALDFDRGFEWEKQPEMNWFLDILDNPAVDPAGRRFRVEKWLRRWDENDAR